MKKVLTNKVTKLNEKRDSILNEKMSKSDKMRKLFDLGYSIKQISDLLQVRYNFVYNVISIYVLKTDCNVESSKTETKKDVIIKMINEDVSVKDIVSKLKVNVNYVYKVKKEVRENQKVQTENKKEEVVG